MRLDGSHMLTPKRGGDAAKLGASPPSPRKSCPNEKPGSSGGEAKDPQPAAGNKLDAWLGNGAFSRK